MAIPLGGMSVGDVFDRAIKVYLARFPAFFVIQAIAGSPILGLELAQPFLLGGDVTPADPQQALAFAGLFLLALALTGFVLAPLATGAILYIIVEEFFDRRAGVGRALLFALRRFGSLLLVSLLFGLILAGGMCLVVVWVLFLVWFQFCTQVVVVEGKGAGAALTRSMELTAGHRWRVAGFLALAYTVYGALAGFGASLQLLLPFQESVQGQFMEQTVFTSYRNYAIDQVGNFLMTTLAGNFLSICTTLFYFDLRNRKEGYDLELAARQPAPAAP